MYGQNIVTNLAKQLTAQYGSGFDRSSLYKYVRFYQCFPNIVDAASPQSFLLTRFSILKGNEQLYATKYQLYLPTKEELRREIETQKELFALQHQS